MADGGEKSGGDLYAVLGLNKECSDAELRNAYKKLAMRWHPDKCSASGNTKHAEEAKEKFQEIQGAYSVLSDSNKRFLYDVGVYDSDDESNGMADFLGEMAQMMSQTKPNLDAQESTHESFEELQQLFVDMFQADLAGGCCGIRRSDGSDRFAGSSSSSSPWGPSFCNGGSKRGNSDMNSGKSKLAEFDRSSAGFCVGSNDSGQCSKGKGGSNSNRRNGRKQKISPKHDVSSRDAEISA